jgi:hypothetical protein
VGRHRTGHRQLPASRYVGLATETIGKLIQSPDTPAAVRADLSKFLYEQVAGKLVQKSAVEV